MATKRQRPEADGATQAADTHEDSSLPAKVLKTADASTPTSDELLKPDEVPEQESSEAGAALQELPPTALDPEEVLLSALEQEMAEYDAAHQSSRADAKVGKIALIGNVVLPHVLEDDDYDESEESD